MVVVAAAVYDTPSGGLSTTITAARYLADVLTTGPPTDENDYFHYIRGYTDNSDWYEAAAGVHGSMGADQYQDGGDTTRTIEHVGYYEDDNGSPLSIVLDMVFMLNGTGIADSDTTFVSIEVEKSTGGNETYLRSSAIYDSSQNGGTLWRWSNVAHTTHFLVANNDHDFVVNV